MGFQVVSLGSSEYHTESGPCIGFAPKDLTRLMTNSEDRNNTDVWSYNCRTGELYSTHPQHVIGPEPLPVAKDGDEISLVLFPDARVHLLKNGKDIGQIFRDISLPVRPVVELNARHSVLCIVPPSAA